jgi:hypothetical protein
MTQGVVNSVTEVFFWKCPGHEINRAHVAVWSHCDARLARPARPASGDEILVKTSAYVSFTSYFVSS